MSSSSLGPLSSLPLKCADFTSACFTARVPRSALTLIIVRVVATDKHGLLDINRSRTTAMLFDGRHKMSKLKTAVVDTVYSSKQRGETAELIDKLMLFSRISGAVVPISINNNNDRQRDVLTESVVPDGLLRGSVHSGGSLRAYLKHTTVRSTVCMKTASRVVKSWNQCNNKLKLSAETDRYAKMYINGLQKMGATKPTHILPDECVCTGKTESCDCFMRRAMWRSGNSWMILYAVLPPFANANIPNELPEPTPEWLQKLIDTTTTSDTVSLSTLTEDCDADDDIMVLEAMDPRKWQFTLTHALAVVLVSTPHHEQPCGLDDSSESESTTVSSSTDSITISNQFVASTSHSGEDFKFTDAAVAWAIRQDWFVTMLQHVSKHIGVFYGPSLRYVAAKAKRSRFYVQLTHRAREMARMYGDEQIMSWLKHTACDSGTKALMYSLTYVSKESSSKNVNHATLEVCEFAGYTCAVLIAVLVCCDTVVSDNTDQTKKKNTTSWTMYDVNFTNMIESTRALFGSALQ